MEGGEEPRLLLREQEELDAVAALLAEKRPALVFLVCATDLRGTCRSYLAQKSGVAVPEPLPLTEPGATLDVLVQASEGPAGAVASWAVEHDAGDVLRTLNWHREKLRRGGAVLLWLDGLEGLRALRSWAPDAYSFRDEIVIARGERDAVVRGPDETSEIQLRRLWLQEARTTEERAAAMAELANALRMAGATEEPRALLSEAFRSMPQETVVDEVEDIARAGIAMDLAAQARDEGSLIEARRWVRQASAYRVFGTVNSEGFLDWSLHPMERSICPLHASVFSQRMGAIDMTNWRFALKRWLLRVLDAKDLDELDKILALKDLVALERWEARVYGTKGLDELHKILALKDLATEHRVAGRLALANETGENALRRSEHAGRGTADVVLHLLRCLMDQGELTAARRSLDDLLAHTGDGSLHRIVLDASIGEILVLRGEIPEGFTHFRCALRAAAEARADGALYWTARSFIASIRLAHDAGRLPAGELDSALVDLGAAEEVALALSGADPPWYSVLYPGLRAELLALDPARHDEAVMLAETALSRARAAYPDAVPLQACILVTRLLEADRLADARAALSLAEPELAAQEDLRELAQLQSLAVVALARTGASPADIDARMATLRATLDTTGAPRIRAEILYHLARLLPADTTTPDPLALLQEADSLFLEMPMPAEDARCLLRMGDILTARARPIEARRRYLTARSICERYGFALWIPQISSRIDALP